jgi:hypothetical protein
MKITRLALALLLASTAGAGIAVPDTMARDQILEIGWESYLLKWYCDTANIYSGVTNATCQYSSPGWQQGVAYKWGGYDSRDAFYRSVVTNLGRAGDVNSAATVSGTYGDDCSGYVSLCLRSGRYSTSGFPSVTTEITYPVIAPGDIMNKAGSHVRMFEKYTGTNLTMEFESTTGVSPGRVTRRVLSTDSSYLARRYNYVVAWPSIVRAVATGASSATIEFLGAATTGFRVYRSTDAVNWTRIADEATLGVQAQSATASGLANGTTYFFRVTAVNGATESDPSCVFPVRIATGARKALIVSGFDRWIRKTESGGKPHTLLTRYSESLEPAGYSFDTVDNLRVLDGVTALSQYSSVWWMLGDESSTDDSLSHQEQLKLQDYLAAGGKLFISGSEILYDLVSKANTINDTAFAANYLKAGYVSDGASGNGYVFAGISGTECAGISANFDNGTAGTINVLYPDVITPQGGAKAVFQYSPGSVAATLYKGTFGSGTVPGAVFVCGFPLESVTTPAGRSNVVNAATSAFFAGAGVEAWDRY